MTDATVPPKTDINWDQYLEDVEQLIKAILNKGVTSMHCYGVPIDGLIPSVILARRLGMEVTDGPRSVMHSYKNESVLIVAGWSDLGEDFITWRGKDNIRTASLYLTDNRRPRVVPDVHGRIVPGPVVFPYDIGAPPRVPKKEDDILSSEGTVW